MKTSVSANNQPDQQGFTLLEVLVVVTLLALFASLTLPMMGRDAGAKNVTQHSKRLHDTLRLLAENSMFRGQVLALRVDDTEYQPLFFDIQTQEFLPFDDNPLLAAYKLPEDYLLEWQLGETDEGYEKDLLSAVQSMTISVDDENELPQLFFFPSGETTPIKLIMRDSESAEEVTMALDTFGRVAIEGDDSEEDEDEDE